MDLRLTRSSVGIGAMVFGAGGSFFALFALGIILIQRVIFTLAGSAPRDPTLGIIHALMLTHMPIMLTGGLVLVLLGRRLRAGSANAAFHLRVAALVGASWVLVYLAHSALSLWRYAPEFLPPPLRQFKQVFFGFWAVTNLAVGLAPFIALLWALERAERAASLESRRAPTPQPPT